VDLPLAGGPDVLHAVYGELEEDGRLRAVAGDSYVLIAEWDTAGGVRSWSIQPYGSAVQDTTSPHYTDQAPWFAERRLKPVWMDEADIRAHLERETVPGESAP
jgi:acyl-homoserine lactone acylase PvdQ